MRAGLAREVIRFLQESRKQAGFDVSDRIEVRWSTADGGVAAAIEEHAATIADEVLAVAFEPVRARVRRPSRRSCGCASRCAAFRIADSTGLMVAISVPRR